jgi:hypothetical protein
MYDRVGVDIKRYRDYSSCWSLWYETEECDEKCCTILISESYQQQLDELSAQMFVDYRWRFI